MGIKITIERIVIEVDVKEGNEVLPSIERTSENVEEKLNAFEKWMEKNARDFAKNMNGMVVRKDNGATVILKKKDASTGSATASSGLVVKKEEKKSRKTNTHKNEEPYTKEEQKARKKVLMKRYLLKKKGELTESVNDSLDALLAEIDEKKRATYEFK